MASLNDLQKELDRMNDERDRAFRELNRGKIDESIFTADSLKGLIRKLKSKKQELIYLANLDAKLVVLTEKELEDLIYKVSYDAANKATTSLYNGLAQRFLYNLEDDVRAILHEIEEMNR